MKYFIISFMVAVTGSISTLAGAISSPSIDGKAAIEPSIPSIAQMSPDVSSLVDSNTAFALDLYSQLSHGEGNLFFSPC